MVYFIKQVKQAGFNKVYGEDGGPILNKTLQLLGKLGLKIEKSDSPKYYWMASL